ncbi:hypothetical protein [Lysinibacillus sp. NPDC056232]|uniref:hypothetical protein n=1 Tax=Lysinibacillus sp. NPDC056232 TaxID=3345756 RepID=UPI0035D88FEC
MEGIRALGAEVVQCKLAEDMFYQQNSVVIMAIATYILMMITILWQDKEQQVWK